MKPDKEINPPWVEFPGRPPGAFFWREEGETWFCYVWEPFWNSLSEKDKEAYLEKYHVPDEWQRFYFDTAFQDWLKTVDDD